MEIREGSDNGEPPVVLGSDSQKKYYQDIVKKMMEVIEFNV
jgi:hypothetical protein